MKRCPVCNTRFEDVYLSFCPNDGTPLVRATAEEIAPTVLLPSTRDRESAPGAAPNPPPTHQPYGWANDTPAQWVPPPPPSIPGPANQQQTLAVASMILGLVGITFGWICGGPFFALLALILGIVALMQIKKDPLRFGGKPMAVIGVILGALVLAIYLVFMAIWAIMMIVGAAN
ncbi:MAG: DUF4190 domain-containing protein [Pyrinomonadaceae bacterium]